MAILLTILIFGIIIVIHEYGHFIAARKCGVFVEEFAVGMGPKIYSKEKGGTLYSIRAIPLGGFCKMKDEDSKSTDSDSFGNATKLKKFIILFAGAFMNFLLAIFIFIAISFFTGFVTNQVKGLAPDFPAQNAGLKEGDLIYKLNGQRIRTFDDLTFKLMRNGEKEFSLTVKRNGEKIDFNLTPISESGKYLIGITPVTKSPFFGKKTDEIPKAGFFQSIYNGFWNMVFTVKVSITGVIELFTAKLDIENVMGPIGLTPVINETYQEAVKGGFLTTLFTMLNITALLSANIGVMNLLPIPALDGGRILFLIVEIIRRKPITEEKEGMIHFVGFVILIAFGLFIAFKDLINIF